MSEQNGLNPGEIQCDCGKRFMAVFPQPKFFNDIESSVISVPHQEFTKCDACGAEYSAQIVGANVGYAFVRVPPEKQKSPIITPKLHVV